METTDSKDLATHCEEPGEAYATSKLTSLTHFSGPLARRPQEAEGLEKRVFKLIWPSLRVTWIINKH